MTAKCFTISLILGILIWNLSLKLYILCECKFVPENTALGKFLHTYEKKVKHKKFVKSY